MFFSAARELFFRQRPYASPGVAGRANQTGRNCSIAVVMVDMLMARCAQMYTDATVNQGVTTARYFAAMAP